MKIDWTEETNKGRFSTTTDTETAYVEYEKPNEKLLIVTHTIVPKAMEGQGIAAALTKALLEHAKENNLLVAPICPYTTHYLERHPEYATIISNSSFLT